MVDYKTEIVSTQETCTFLHRTSRNLVDKIMSEGLCCGADIRSSATWQPQDLEKAEALFRQTHKGNNAVVVVKIPRKTWETARAKARANGSTAEVTFREVGYFNPKKGNFTVRPEFVAGWIDRNSGEYHTNPYPDRKPVQGHENFDYLLE